MKSDRLFQILYILLERRNVTAPELANLLEVSVRTIYRDVEALAMSDLFLQNRAAQRWNINHAKVQL